MEEKEENEKSLKEKLNEIKEEIKTSWLRDCDKTEYMILLTKMLKEMQTKDSLEEYFSNNEEDLSFFMGECLNDILYNILVQPIIFGEKGDEIGLELLLNIYKLFQKFHKNKKYAPLFGNIRQIFDQEKKHDFFSCTDQRNRNPVKKYNYMEFNKEYNSEYFKKDKINKFEKGDEVDIPIDNKYSKNYLDKKSWVRGRIKEIKDDEYIIEYGEEDELINLSINDYNIYPAGNKTKDWDWRTSLKKYDVIDGFDRGRWYPSTIMKVIEDEINGFKYVKYKIGFRLYPQHFKNPEDENDKCENHLDIWKKGNFENSHDFDSEKEKFYGDKENYDETIPHYSKRIQKFNTYSKCQQKNLDYSFGNNFYSSNEKINKMMIMNEKLQNDTEISIEELYDYGANGKKNCIIGKDKNFLCYYAIFLKKMEIEGSFHDFIEILKNEPNAEEIYNIFFILSNAFTYIHSDYFKENSKIIKDSLIKFINNLDNKEMRNLPKDLIDIISDLLKKIQNYNTDDNSDNKENDEALDLYDELNLALSTKIIKTSIFDRRLQGIKSLNEYIEKNNNNPKICKKIINIIKENKIIEEIFGANYHSQIINKSTDIVKLLLSKNELSEDDMKLIWSCTKRGDLEAKVTILKLLSELSDNLDDKSVKMLLNNIISNVDKKINKDEIELVYKLSMKGDNKNNILILCDYFCQCLLSLNNANISNNNIFLRLLSITLRDEDYLKKVLNICENCLKTNERAIMSYSIIYQIMERSNSSIKILLDFIKNEHLLNLYKDNFHLYIKQAKEQLTKNNISLTEGDIIDKYIFDGFSHLDNIKKRIEFFPYLINVFYKDFNFLPFLKDVLITNSVSPNDQLIFYDFVEKYLNNNQNNIMDDETNKKKEEIKNELFELISDKNQKEVTMEQLKLFIHLFFDINKIKTEGKDDECEIISSYNIDEIKGLDNFWNIILRTKDQKILSISINILFQIYKNKYAEKLLEKCNNLINGENSNPEIIEKCLMLLKLIIIESEKDVLFKPKSHLSLLKNCLIHLSLNSKNRKPDLEKSILFGNTTLNDLKIIISNLYEILPESAIFSLSEEYLNKVKEIKNIKNKQLFEKEIDGSNNNDSLYELLSINNNIIPDLKPGEKINVGIHRKKVSLIENGEMNPKLKEILKEWFYKFTNGKGKMDFEASKTYILNVTNVGEDQAKSKARDFLSNYDKGDEKFLTEEEFINFNKLPLNKGNEDVVWKNLYKMGFRDNLKKKEESLFEYIDKDKLPRYKLGNDLNFIQNLIKQFYKNPTKSNSLLEFSLYLSTNENIYNEVLNMYNEENKDSLINKALNDENKYIEQNYIFIIIESILQDLEVNMYKNDNAFEKNEYRLIQNKYEPFDDEDKDEKKLNFLKNLIKKENFEKIIKYVNNLLVKIKNIDDDKEEKSNENKNDNISSYLYTCCLQGIKIINIINNLYEDTGKEIYINKLKENHIFILGQSSLSLLLKDFDFKSELNNISYLDLINNLISYLNNSKIDDDEQEKNMKSYLYKVCLDLLIDLFCSKKQIFLKNISTNESIKKVTNELFKNNFTKTSGKMQKYFIEKIKKSVEKSIQNQNNDYILFLFEILNSLLDKLLNLGYDQSEQDKKEEIFFPDQTFFELYNNLFKLVSEIKNKDENKENSENKINVSDLDNANSFLTKLYSILMKALTLTPGGDDKKVDDKELLSLLKLFIILVKDNEKLRNEILFKNTKGEVLFDLLFNRCISQFGGNNKNGDENNINLICKNEEENKEDKFICLETLKKEEKVDNSSKEELNEICNEFVLECFKESKNPQIISKLLEMIDLIKKSLKKEKKNGKDSDSDSDENNNGSIASNYFHNNYSSKQNGHVGLKNLGCICYMNSIMQQMYMVPTFRYAIMHADDGESPKSAQTYRFTIEDDNLLHQLQIMYTYLTFSEKMDYNPRNFCYSFKDFDGKPINIGSQQDSQEFYNNFCDKIENSLKKTKYKYIVNDVFTGRTCSSVLCQGCKHISNRFEDFYNLTLEVKNINNLNDSLQKLIIPEIIDDFKCSNCNQSVQIKKVTSLNKLPNVLVVHLKRFYLDYETCHTRKINSKFEFPKKLNLKLFCVEEVTKKFGSNQSESTDIYNREDEYYQYELKGINVHTGSADGGHYFSFIDTNREGKDNNMNGNPENKNNWLIFNDSHVSIFDTDRIPSECYGGSNEGYSYENCQNAYLLIYERKKKTPIKIILDEKEVETIDKDKLITIEKEKKNELSKEYDMSRIGNNINEKDLYSLVFFDKEKNEYYKYIPYYNIRKFAPKKAYLECLKDNNKTPSTKSGNKKNNEIMKKYKEILVDKLSNNNFDIKDQKYNDEMKENIINIILDNFMKKLNKKQKLDQSQKEEINKELCEILQKMVQPLIEEETNINILNIINSAFSKEDNLDKIFSNGSSFPIKADIITLENAQKVADNLFNLITIFIKKKDEQKYFKELKKILEAIFALINRSKTDRRPYSNSNDNEKNFSIICIYQLIYKLFTTKDINDMILSILIQNDIISTLINKLDDEKEDIRKIIYDCLIYLVKQTDEYKKEFFELKEGEKEGVFDFHDKEILQRSLDSKAKKLFKEKKDLLFMLLTILEHNSNSATSDFVGFTFKLFELYERKGKLEKYLEDLLYLILTQVKVNDKLSFERLNIFLGYPTLVIKDIPRKLQKKRQPNAYNNYDDDDDHNNGDNDNDNESEEKEKKEQKWPLFGERLINGNIYKNIYRYKSNNNRYKNRCLLNLLFPYEDLDIKNNNKEKKNDDNHNIKNNNDNAIDDDNENDNVIDEDDEIVNKENKKNENLVIPSEIKRKILLDIINNCLGELNNYTLFKYLYLMPARSLFYKNLYEEIMAYLNDEKSLNFEKIKEKEEMFIKNIEKEIKKAIEKAKKKDKEGDESQYGYYRNNFDDDDDEDENDDCPPTGGKPFNCYSKKMKDFIGFNSDIIAGEIIREEISEIATSGNLGMYRIEYFTKYYNVDDLRKKFLNNKNKDKSENANINEKISEKENNEEEKDNKKEEKDNKKEKEDNKEEEKDKKEGEKSNKEEEKDNKDKDNKEEEKDNKKEEEEKDNKEEDKAKIEEEENDNKEEVKDNKEDEKDNKEEEKDNKKEEKDNKMEENKEENLESSNNNKNGNKNEDEKGKNKDKEKIETEIEEVLDKKSTNQKYDISQVNESSLIYKKFRNGIKSYILEENSIKDKSKVKSTLIRYYFVNESQNDKEFKATLMHKNISNLKKLNFFSPEDIFDEVKENNITNFNNLYRLRADLPFLKQDNIVININLN